MNRQISGVILIITIILALFLTSCETVNAEPPLSGSFGREYYSTKTVYTFYDENAVSATYYAAGFEVYSYEGTFTLNEEENEIVLSFPIGDGQTGSGFPGGGATTVSRTYAFEKGEGYIIIGTDRYEAVTESSTTDVPNSEDESAKNAESTKTDETPELPKSEDIPDDLALKLPDEYKITYAVTEGKTFNRAYTQTMIKTDEGIYLELGDTGIGERYVFEKLASGKYIMYQYDAVSGKYTAPMISGAILEQIDKGNMTLDMVAVDGNVLAGYAARIVTYFDYYKTFQGRMKYEGDEQVNGFSCKKYTASFTTVIGEQSVELWIEPELGLCIRGVYSFKSEMGQSTGKTIECTEFVTDGVSLPDYK